MYPLQNKIALVGGASQGLGAACAIRLAAAGATVIVYARTEEKLKQSILVSYMESHNMVWQNKYQFLTQRL